MQIDESLFRGRRKYNRGRLLLGNLNDKNENNVQIRREIMKIGVISMSVWFGGGRYK